jgi:hypothetical protein
MTDPKSDRETEDVVEAEVEDLEAPVEAQGNVGGGANPMAPTAIET